VPHIILGGADWYAKLGTPKNGGTRLFCLAGHLNKPGVYELPMGYNLKKMIYEVGGGIPNGRSLKAVVPGGSSTPVLLPEEIDVAMDFDSVAKAGSMLGSGGVVVLDDTTCIVKFALRTIKFYQHESCGWCIPCREGTDWLKKTLTRFHAGAGVKERYRQYLLPCGKHAGEDFLSAGRRGGDADHGIREEVQKRV
jgi:NADH-quinone oxidoreductase subunit F